MDKYEFYVLFVLGFLVVLFGVYPMCILRVIEAPITFLLISIREDATLIKFFDKAYLLSYDTANLLQDYVAARRYFAAPPFADLAGDGGKPVRIVNLRKKLLPIYDAYHVYAAKNPGAL